MNLLTVRKAKPEEISLLNQMQEEAFATTLCYFPDGELPGPPPDADYSLTELAGSPDHTLLAFCQEQKIVGGALIREHGDNVREIELLFIQAENIGHGLGAAALSLTEKYFPDTRLWRLITPTQIMKNVIFYVNKCGYHIVKVENFEREKNAGIYVFEKIVK